MVNVRSRIKRVIKFSRAQEQKKTIICSAIKQLRPIEFYYLHGYRTVEPFALGIVLTEHQDNLSILCWQTSGFSDLNETEGWKLYRVSDMEDIEIQVDHFTGIRPGYEPENLEMVKVICYVPQMFQAEQPASPPPPPVIIEETPPAVRYEPPPPPPQPPPPQPEFRPIMRVLSHNQLMSRFRYAHPQPIPQLEDLIWQEPLTTPFPEPDSQSAAEAAQTEIWPDQPPRDYGQQTA